MFVRFLLVVGSIVSLAVAGCGGRSGFDIVPVSGIVKLDGQALAGATVTFLPQASSGQNAGPASVGVTDGSGKFTLKTGSGEMGAVVATHQVMITSKPNSRWNANDDNLATRASPDRIPARYNSDTTLTFVVPGGGSEEANFELTSSKRGA